MEVRGQTGGESDGGGRGPRSLPPGVGHIHKPLSYTAFPYYKRGKLGRWIQEDNTGLEVMGVRWLLSEHRRRGKEVSSLVIYTKSTKEIAAMRVSGRFFSTEKYDWNRGHPRQDSGI